MNTDRIITILQKEWAEVFKNRIVIVTITAVPLLLVAIPLGIIAFSSGSATPVGSVTDLPPAMLEACGALSAKACFQLFLLNQFLPLFMFMPLFIPIAIAAYSIVGEKTTRSLEPLLATPITTEELLISKALAAVIPAVLATWGAFLFLIIGAPIVGMEPIVLASALNQAWLVAIFIIGPLLSILSVNFALIVSSRVTDPRVAEQISAVLIVPILGFIFGQLAGVILADLKFMAYTALVLVGLDVALVYLGARLFQRETILTKWK
jgi:ABC-2 type transport system permease protein